MPAWDSVETCHFDQGGEGGISANDSLAYIYLYTHTLAILHGMRVNKLECIQDTSAEAGS